MEGEGEGRGGRKEGGRNVQCGKCEGERSENCRGKASPWAGLLSTVIYTNSRRALIPRNSTLTYAPAWRVPTYLATVNSVATHAEKYSTVWPVFQHKPRIERWSLTMKAHAR